MAHSLIPSDYSETDYARERSICDKANAYWEANAQFYRNGCSSLGPEKARHPDYAVCDSDMRGRVEQWELLHNPPERFTAYIGSDGRYLTTWTGHKLGIAGEQISWRAGYTKITQYLVLVTGTDGIRREYTGRGQGAGMNINLRETAASKRARGV